MELRKLLMILIFHVILEMVGIRTVIISWKARSLRKERRNSSIRALQIWNLWELRKKLKKCFGENCVRKL
jgi:hypothetical protein